jgi:ribonuclease III
MKLLEERIDYQFKDRKVLLEALTHPSMSTIDKGTGLKSVNYERLEFLGDSVLSLIVTELLINNYPDEPEGKLAKRRAVLVSGATLSKVAKELHIGDSMIMTDGERNAGGQKNPRNLENTIEAIIGGIYIDGGMEEAKVFIVKHWLPLVQAMKIAPTNPKTALQEWAQKRGKPIPIYKVVSNHGPAHSPEFNVEVMVENLDPVQARGKSKKVAEVLAAVKILNIIKDSSDE